MAGLLDLAEEVKEEPKSLLSLAEPLDKDPRPTSSYAGGLLRQFAGGLTLGFDDELQALGERAVGGDYGEASDRIRRQKERFAEENPWASTLAHGAGTIGSFMLPIGWLARLGKAGKLAYSALPQSNMARIGLHGPQAPGAVTRMLPARWQATSHRVASNPFHQMGMAGVKGSAIMAAGEAEGPETGHGPFVDTVEGLKTRLDAALDPGQAALSYGLGRGLGWLGTKGAEWGGRKVGDIVDLLQRARAEGSTPAAAGASTVARYIGMDQGDIQAIRNMVMPQHRRMTPEQVEPVVLSYFERVGRGLSDREARRQIVDEIMNSGAHGGVTRGTVENRVRTLLRRYDERHEIPANLQELVALATGGEARNTYGLYRWAGQKPGEQAARAANWAQERQLTQGDRLRDIMERRVGAGDIGASDELMESTARAANALYRPAFDAEAQNPMLAQALQQRIGSILQGWEQRAAGRAGEVSEGIERAIGYFTDTSTGAPVAGLQKFIDAKRELDHAIARSFHEGKPTPLTRQLQQMKSELMTAAGDVNPAFATANQARADAFALNKALEQGLRMSLSASGRRSRELARFRSMSEEEQEMFRRGLSTQLQAKLSNPGDSHDLAKLFNKESMRQLLTEVLGQREVARIYDAIQRVGLSTRTFQVGKNSQTEPMRLVGLDVSPITNLLAQINTYATPWGVANKVLDVVTTRMNAARDDEIMRLLAANTDNPAELLDALRRIEQAAARQSQSAAYQLPGLVQQYGGPASVGLTPTMGVDRRDY